MQRRTWGLVATFLGAAFATASLAGCGDDAGTATAGAGGATSTTSSAGGGEGGAGTSVGGGGASAACAPSFDADRLHLAVGASLAAGEDQTMCLRWTAPEDIDIVALQGTLGPAAGHHALVLVHEVPSGPDGVSPCSEGELMDASSDFQMIAGVSYESDGVRYEFPTSPAAIGLRVREGQQLILDAHFLNAGAEPVDACASIDFELGEILVPLQFRTILPEEQYDLVVPANGNVDATYEEPIGESFRVAAASSHMHEGGRSFRLSVVESEQVLYESTDWSDPVPRAFDAERVIVDGAHTFRLDCSFVNETTTDRRFPQEMCVGGLYLLPCSFPGAC